MANSFYMDDFLSSLSDEKSLIRLSLLLISCLKTCGFRLIKRVSSSKVVLENIPFSELSPKFTKLDLNSQPIERVLEMKWNVSETFFVFKSLLKQCVYVKRGFLRIVASIFGRLGIFLGAKIKSTLMEREDF